MKRTVWCAHPKRTQREHKVCCEIILWRPISQLFLTIVKKLGIKKHQETLGHPFAQWVIVNQYKPTISHLHGVFSVFPPPRIFWKETCWTYLNIVSFVSLESNQSRGYMLLYAAYYLGSVQTLLHLPMDVSCFSVVNLSIVKRKPLVTGYAICESLRTPRCPETHLLDVWIVAFGLLVRVGSGWFILVHVGSCWFTGFSIRRLGGWLCASHFFRAGLRMGMVMIDSPAFYSSPSSPLNNNPPNQSRNWDS